MILSTSPAYAAADAAAGRGGPLLDGEAPQSVSEGDVVGLLETVLRLPKLAAAAREVALTAAMKLTARLPSQVRGRPVCVRAGLTGGVAGVLAVASGVHNCLLGSFYVVWLHSQAYSSSLVQSYGIS
jgi:hypothetical protein